MYGKMFHIKVLLSCICFFGFGSCQGVNVALTTQGGRCLSSLVLSDCKKLIDGSTSGGNNYRWSSSLDVIGEYILFQFDSAYHINQILVTHSYEPDERNIKTVKLVFEDEFTTTFEFKNTDKGLDQKDILNISARSTTMNMTITDVYDLNAGYTALYQVEVYGTTIASSIATSSSGTSRQTSPSIITTEIFVEDTTQISATQTMKPEEVTPTISTSTSPPTLTSAVFTEIETTSTSTTHTTTKPTTPTTVSTSTTSEQSEVVSGNTNSADSTTTLSSYTTSIAGRTTEEGETSKQNGPNSTKPPAGIIVGVIMAVLVIAVVLLIVGLILRRRKKNVHEKPDGGNVYVNMNTLARAAESEPKTRNQIPFTDTLTEDNLSRSSTKTSESSKQDLKLVDGEPEYANTQSLPVDSNAIKLSDFASAVDDMLQNPMIFQEEFKSIPAGKQHATTFADRSTLQPKNRFKNIKPYDHSRVSLAQKDTDDSVYINANFISAYKRPKYYIAAQGPNRDTVTDFWRMIWEQDVSVIVMATNCIEGGKDKCKQYWPDGEKGAQQSFGDFEVAIDKNTLLADYTIRDFKLSQNEESRNVRQYHYTSWPDEGVPTSCSALISFVNRIREYTEDKEPPIVVHCSAGVGRTGTFIVVNYSIEMAQEEGIVDIKKVVHRLREDRINMVQTLSQYKFLYALMLEYLYCGEVTIPCQGASEKIQQIFIKQDGKDSQAEIQWKVLEVLKPTKYHEECLAGKDKDNIEKNRTQTILPHDNHRPYLRRRPDYTSNYINAVFVDGYKKKNKFLLTQHPLENTVVDLWRTVSDFNVSTIVMLNGCAEDAEAYWPEDEYSGALQYGDFLEVTFKRVDKQDDFTITELDLSEDKEKANVVTHIQVKNWSEDSKPKLSILPALYNIVTQAQMTDEDSRIMIHTLNGGGKTGVYCALHQIFDKIKEEQEIDIFNAVKNTRMPRPDTIPDLETYKYLHEASVQFIEEFSTYANFR